MKDVVFQEMKLVGLGELNPDPEQPRQDFDDGELQKLRDSILLKGIMSPIVVEPKTKGKYLIIDGERRYRVAQQIKLRQVPVNILSKMLNKAERNIIRFQLQETHKQWSAFEKAEAMLELKETLGIGTAELARALALSKITVERYLAILTFAPKARKVFTAHKLPFTIMEVMAYTKNLMPSKMATANPDWVENIVKKYKKGLIKGHKDLRSINRLIRHGEYEVVNKFLKDNNYTASNAKVDSGDERTQLIEQIYNGAKKLTQNLIIAEKNKIKLDGETNMALQTLQEIL